MTIGKPPLYFLILLLLVGSSVSRRVEAQSSIMNVPSTAIEEKGHVCLEMDFISNYAWEGDDTKSQNYLLRAFVGLGHSLEAGANLSYTRVPGGGEPIELQPNLKWQFHTNETLGTAAAIGSIFFLPVINRAGTNTLGQCYLVGSITLKGNLAPIFTGGAYALINARGDERTEAGAIVAYEQPLTKTLSFNVDWSSGDNRLGYVSPGFCYAISETSDLTIGYTIANHGRGKNAVFVYYGIQF